MHIRRPGFFDWHAQSMTGSIRAEPLALQNSRTAQSHHALCWKEWRLHQNLGCIACLVIFAVGNQLNFFFLDSPIRRPFPSRYPERQLAFVRASLIVAD